MCVSIRKNTVNLKISVITKTAVSLQLQVWSTSSAMLPSLLFVNSLSVKLNINLELIGYLGCGQNNHKYTTELLIY